MKYQFIAAHQEEYAIKTMCRVLEVAVSGYYAWLRRTPSRRSQANTVLGERMVQLYQANRQVMAAHVFTPRCEPKATLAGRSEWPDSCASKG